MYTVDAAVGPGCPNGRHDVLLVQYFLRESFKGFFAFQQDPFPGVVPVDGAAGAQTLAAILHFQRVAKKHGKNIATDGRVDPQVADHSCGTISGTQYTMIYMNMTYQDARPADWPRVSKAGDCPGELRTPLKEPVFI
jgi:hypothetical protein